MTINIWTKDLKDCYLWTSKVKEIYVGASKVYPSIINFATQWPCPDWFHVPTKADWSAVYSAWLSIKAWSSSTWSSIKYYLKLPYCWYRYYDWTIKDSSSWYYWSSTRNDWTNANYLLFYDSWIRNWNYNSIIYWMSIRPFKNTAVIPDSSWTTALSYWSSWAWIYYNTTLWLISISSNGSTWYTLSDKNLWATTVWNNWDTVTEQNWWKFFQWGNNYWFNLTWTLTTHTTAVDSSTYWPWNYYTYDKFYVNPWYWSYQYRRDTTDNYNLWWWVDWNVPV